MKITDLLKKIASTDITGVFNSENEISGITADSREKNTNGIFVAVKGLHSDGALFANQAIANGAIVVIYESSISELISGVCYIKVSATRQIQGEIAALLFNKPAEKLSITGITGTNGKTSFCYILRHLLNNSGKKCGLFGNIEYDLGNEKIIPRLNTPEAIDLQKYLFRMVENQCSDLVMEVSSHGLVLDRVRGVEFERAVFSNLTQDHLDFHGSMQNYAESKALLFNKYLKSSGLAIINIDDEMADFFITASLAPVLTYGRSGKADLVIRDYRYNQRGLIVDYAYQGKKFSVSSNLEGSFQVYNLTAAILTAISYKIEISAIQQALQQNLTIPGRLEQINGGNFKVFVDYAHTPDALVKAISAIKDLPFRKLTVIFGCGGDRDKTKRPIMGKTACSSADSVIITSDNPRTEDPTEIIRDIEQGISEFSNYQVIENRSLAIISALKAACDNEIILIAGKGHENYQEINGVKHFFSDQQEVLNYLKAREA